MKDLSETLIRHQMIFQQFLGELIPLHQSSHHHVLSYMDWS